MNDYSPEEFILPKNQGQGIHTIWKEVGFKAAFRMQMRLYPNILRQSWPARPIFHFDLNAGSGYNDAASCHGSPIHFLEAAREEGFIAYCAYFVDSDEQAINQLEQRLADYNSFNTECIIEDNAKFIQRIPDLVRQHTTKRFSQVFGTVLIDPNGSDVPIWQLGWLFQQFSRLDLILNANSTQFKRDRLAFPHLNRPYLSDVIAAMNKKAWLIRDPVGSYQWTILVGRNWEYGDYQAMGFYKLSSEHGQEILLKCEYSKSEIERIVAVSQGKLFQ